MKCEYCKDEISIEHNADDWGGGLWIVSCQCDETRHPHMEKAIELHRKLVAVKKARGNNDNS